MNKQSVHLGGQQQWDRPTLALTAGAAAGGGGDAAAAACSKDGSGTRNGWWSGQIFEEQTWTEMQGPLRYKYAY